MKLLNSIMTVAFITVGFNANAADGAAVFTKECAKCHGADGKGDTKPGKMLKIKDLTVEQAKLSDDQIAKTVKEGLQADGKMRMKPIKGLTDEEVQAVAKFVHTLKK